jgi:sec-independent protein translocase protein TatB
MFGIGIIEVFVIFVIAILVLGPERIPEAAASLAKGMRTVKQFINEIKGSVHDHPLIKNENTSLGDTFILDSSEDKK